MTKNHKVFSQFLVLVIFLITGCENVDRELIEKRWISNLEIDLEKKHFVPNYIFELKNGKGFLAEVGRDKVEFNYELRGNSLVIKETKNTLGEILSYDQDNLKINFLGLDTLEFVKMELELKSSELKQLKNTLIDHSFVLLNHDGSSKQIVHFTEDEMFLLSLDLKNRDGKFPKLDFRRMGISMETISNFTVIRVGGMTENLEYPLIGIIEKMEDQIQINTFTDDGFYQSKLTHFKSPPKDINNILFEKQWRLYGGDRLETFDFLENGMINHEKNGVKSKLK